MFSSDGQPHAYMSCGLKLNTDSPRWQRSLSKVLRKIKGASYTIDAEEGMAYVSGRVNPNSILRELVRSGKDADLSWLTTGNHNAYGNAYYEDDSYVHHHYRGMDPYYMAGYHQPFYMYNNYGPMAHYYPQRALPPMAYPFFYPYGNWA